MEWTSEHDLCLCQEILVLEPFKAKRGSITRGQIWDKIANNLNNLQLPRFRVTKRSVRERYTLLNEKFKKKMREEEKASGIETDMSEVEKALEEISEKEAVAEDTLDSNKKKADNAKAVDMQKMAMESLSSTRKRKSDEGEEMENAKSKPKSSRRSGADTIAYLREKNEMAHKWKGEELELQKQRLEVENKRQDELRKQHQDMMQVLVQQTKQQQGQMQSFQQMFTVMQQQQSQIITKLLEKHH